MHYEKNYAYPLLVWLHGPQDDERQVQRLMPFISMRNYVAIGPRGLAQPAIARQEDPQHNTQPSGSAANAYDWDLDDESLHQVESLVTDSIEIACSKFNIAEHRIFLGGYLHAGTLALRIALNNPTRFGGVFSLCGAFPLGMQPLMHLHQARQLPIFLSHGRDSRVYSVERSCEELRLFHAAGMHVSLRQYPGGDDLDTQMLHDLDCWLMEQVTGQKAAEEPAWRPSESN